MSNSSLELAFAECRSYLEAHGKSYAYATRSFPLPLRNATYALYAFFRIPDELVDNPVHDPKEALLEWKSQWHEAYITRLSSNKVLFATAEVFHQYNIPFEYSDDFLSAMLQDIDVDRYATYADLERYMYGSAAVVGLMMSYVIGYSDRVALTYAVKLGYAMQLTNFLRDIREDLETRGRVYLPQEDLQRFHVTEADLQQNRVTHGFTQLMQFEIARADALYEEANQGISLLNQSGRSAVWIASDLYRAILRKIEYAKFDVFERRVRTSTFEKAWISFRASRKV
jgi:phytoene synthase